MNGIKQCVPLCAWLSYCRETRLRSVRAIVCVSLLMPWWLVYEWAGTPFHVGASQSTPLGLGVLQSPEGTVAAQIPSPSWGRQTGQMPLGSSAILNLALWPGARGQRGQAVILPCCARGGSSLECHPELGCWSHSEGHRLHTGSICLADHC